MTRVLSSIVLIVLIIGMVRFASGQTESQPSEQMKALAWVKNSETAIEIGKAIIRERAGADFVKAREPFKAELDAKGIWTVYNAWNPQVGGIQAAIYVRLRRSTGEIIEMGVSP